MHQPGANHAPKASVTQVNHSVHTLSSSADMCLNCSLSVKSTKIGVMTVFKALKRMGYGAIAKTTVKGHFKGSLKTAAFLNRK